MLETCADMRADRDLAARLEKLAERLGDATALVYLDDRGRAIPEQTRTFAQLHRAAAATASDLLDRHQPGDRVLILTAPGLGFLQSFLGCLYAGLIAVPAPLPSDDKGMARLARIVVDAEASEIITTADLYDLVEGWSATVDGPQPLVGVIDDVDESAADTWSAVQTNPDDIAFLQYTSGSTSEPKGVMVTRGNLVHNLGVIHEASRLPANSTVAGWLPHFHDMGLIGQLLYPLFGGHRGVHMSPATFLKRPHLWLQMLTEYKAAGTVAPNFAFDMCIRRVTDEQLATLNLSSVRTVLNGSEPIRAETLRTFTAKYATAGFTPEALCPCYGLAESTLMVSSDDHVEFHVLEADPDAFAQHAIVVGDGSGTRSLVSSGRVRDLDVAIVDPATESRLPDGRIGEIRVRGDSVTAGYWKNPEATAEIFGRSVDGEPGYMCTGDLGAFVDGRLYVTGRAKDVIIVNGRNLYPQDIEHSSREAHSALSGGLGAVFGVGDTEDRIVVIQEVADTTIDEEWDSVQHRIRERIRVDHGVPVFDIVLVERKTVLRTTSGKIRRAEMRRLYLAGALESVATERAIEQV